MEYSRETPVDESSAHTIVKIPDGLVKLVLEPAGADALPCVSGTTLATQFIAQVLERVLRH